MRKSRCKTAFKTMFGILLLFSGIEVTVANNAYDVPLKDSVVYKVTAVHTDTLSSIKRPNFVDQIFDVLPEIFNSFGYDERKIDISFRLISKSLSQKIKVLNKFAEKQTLPPTSKTVKQLLGDLNLRIGGSGFETRELNPDFITKFTPENIRKVSAMLTTLKQNYDSSLKQKTLKAKFKVFKNTQTQFMGFKDMELFKAFAKEYGNWISELIPFKNKGTIISKNGITVADSTQTIKLNLEKEATKKRDNRIYGKAYYLLPEQVKISSLSYKGGNDCQLVKIVRGVNETKVTFTIPIHFDWNWISTDSVSCLIDKQTKDCYHPRRIESGIPLNRVT